MRTTSRMARGSRTSENTDASIVCECPVCLGYYVNPKILPCGHLVCLQCVLHWVGGETRNATCPVCRAYILSHNQLHQLNPPDEVEAWPTDLYTEALSKSLQVLRGPHICSTCRNDVTAVSYCMPCGIKLCPNCATRHKETPATASHRPKPLNDLSTQTLMKPQPEMCKIHPDRRAEVYCPRQQQAICFLCRAANHENCECGQAVAEVERDMIAALSHRVENLQVMEKELSHQVSSAKDLIKTLRKKSDDMFRDLQQMLEEQQQKFNRNIQVEADSVVASVTELNNVQAALTQNSSTIGSLVQGASGAALRQMEKALTARLDLLEKRAKETKEVKPAEFALDFRKLSSLKKEIAGLEDCRPSATIRCTVTNITKMEERVVTPACMIRNLPWKVVLRRGLEGEHGLYLGFFLECNTESKLVWSCVAKAEFRLLRTRADQEPFCRRIEHCFGHGNSDWGFPRFVPFHVLLDPERSYVQDDTINVEVHIEADPPHGAW